MEVSGGESADAIMDLLDATEEPDLSSYERIIKRNRQCLKEPRNAVVLLLAAIWASRTDIVRLLIQEGVSTDSSTHLGMTPLHWAAALGEPSITSELLLSAVQPLVFNWFLITPLELSHLNKCTAVTPLLLAKSTSNPRDLSSFSARTVLARMREIGP